MTLTALAMIGAAGGCSDAADDPAGPVYEGTEIRLLDGELVAFRAAMRGAAGPEDVARYAECVAAQHALGGGYGFARHVQTTIEERGGRWTADAVYTVSAALPAGVRTIDAEVTVADCGLAGIPTV